MERLFKIRVAKVKFFSFSLASREWRAYPFARPEKVRGR
jgi:hypothetical protein